MNIVLVGLMGSGKSSVGRALAEATGRSFVDTDSEVEARAGRPIPAIFAELGEAGFRDLEAATVALVANRDGQVIATGGGAVLRPESREALRRGGIVFWLDAAPEELYRRASADGIQSRPLLAGADPLQKLRALAESRSAAYAAAAHHRVNTERKSPSEVAAAILEILEER